MSTGEESADQTNLRRSARIIALEERKEKEKKELQAARKNNNKTKINNNGANTTNSAMDKGKGKAIEVEHGFDFMDDDSEDGDNDNDDDYLQYAPTKKKGRKTKTLQQLIMQPMHTGQHSGRNKLSSKFSLKDVLEFVLDALQRRDTFGLFAEPVNPDDEGYYRIVKQPMDFATVRAKLHENMYTDIESFKRDVYLICSNAMSVHPSTSFHYQVGEGIREIATMMFSGLKIDPGRFDSLVKICQLKIGGRNPGRPKNLACFKHLISTERRGSQPELERRLTYMPPKDESLFSQVMEAHKESLQFISPPNDYTKSLARFTEGLGPTAQKVAAKQIEQLRFNQMLCGDTPSPNPLAHFLDTTTSTSTVAASQEPPPHATIMQGPSSSNGTNGPNGPNEPNGPTTIPFAAPEETNNSNNDLGQLISSLRQCGDIVGWNAPGSLLGDAYSKDQNEGGCGITGLDLNNDNVGSISSLLPGPGLPSSNVNPIDHFTAHAATRNPQGSNTRAHYQAQVWPTTVISGPQPKPLSNIDRRYSELFSIPPQSTNNLSSPSLGLLSQIMKPTDQPIMDYNYSNVSEQSPFLNGNNNFTFQSFMSLLKSQEPVMTDYDFSGPSMQPQPQEKPTEPMNNFTWQSFMPQSRPNNENIVAGSTNLFGQSFVPQVQKLKAPMIEPMMGYNLSEQSFLSQAQQSLQEPMTGYNNSFPADFQSILGSTNFNNVMPSFPENASLYTLPPPPPSPRQQQMYGLSQDHLAMQPGPGPSLMSGPLGLFPQDDSVQLPPLPQSLSDEMPMGLDGYYGPSSMGDQPAGGGGVEAAAPTSQFLWDDPRLPNLSLQL